ncbi:DUF899 family protein [Streptomyces sp. PSKA54]|uniref:DUF899 family protein n=1 Tax=Streptomyces himalayensis subsp. aureolus TaxID=2758039 RepID=A0A7W2HI37_9ACTN|nr:DUF899 family protein [Streptomyces himalayensis subsp. aureolus]
MDRSGRPRGLPHRHPRADRPPVLGTARGPRPRRGRLQRLTARHATGGAGIAAASPCRSSPLPKSGAPHQGQCEGCTTTAWHLKDAVYLNARGVSFAILTTPRSQRCRSTTCFRRPWGGEPACGVRRTFHAHVSKSRFRQASPGNSPPGPPRWNQGRGALKAGKIQLRRCREVEDGPGSVCPSTGAQDAAVPALRGRLGAVCAPHRRRGPDTARAAARGRPRVLPARRAARAGARASRGAGHHDCGCRDAALVRLLRALRTSHLGGAGWCRCSRACAGGPAETTDPCADRCGRSPCVPPMERRLVLLSLRCGLAPRRWRGRHVARPVPAGSLGSWRL